MVTTRTTISGSYIKPSMCPMPGTSWAGTTRTRIGGDYIRSSCSPCDSWWSRPRFFSWSPFFSSRTVEPVVVIQSGPEVRVISPVRTTADKVAGFVISALLFGLLVAAVLATPVCHTEEVCRTLGAGLEECHLERVCNSFI